MNISYLKPGQFQVKTKQAIISLGPEIKVGEMTLPGPGEYDIVGVEVENKDSGIVLIRCEDLFLLYLDRLNRPLSDSELEQVVIADIVFVPVGGAKSGVADLTVLTPEQAVAVVNQIDPAVVIPMYFESIEAFRAAEGKPLEVTKDYKVTKQSLPEEERQYIVLND